MTGVSGPVTSGTTETAGTAKVIAAGKRQPTATRARKDPPPSAFTGIHTRTHAHVPIVHAFFLSITDHRGAWRAFYLLTVESYGVRTTAAAASAKGYTRRGASSGIIIVAIARRRQSRAPCLCTRENRLAVGRVRSQCRQCRPVSGTRDSCSIVAAAAAADDRRRRLYTSTMKCSRSTASRRRPSLPL